MRPVQVLVSAMAATFRPDSTPIPVKIVNWSPKAQIQPATSLTFLQRVPEFTNFTPAASFLSSRATTPSRLSPPSILSYNPTMPLPAGVAELADAQDLGSCTERFRGSTPLSCI